MQNYFYAQMQKHASFTPTNCTQPDRQTQPPRLLDRVRDTCRLRQLALTTERSYANWIRRFILFHNKRHPDQMGEAEIRDFLTHLARDRLGTR